MNDSQEDKILKEFGKKLEKLRKAKKLSYRNFAYAADLSVSYIQKLEAGDSNPSYTTLLKLAEALNVELNEFAIK
ncbi:MULTISPECIES: helix-turn-helix domain-containing protein [Niastella]|uniref:Helix-turn-helix transcriptional regulator n=1 Tax=Niastella soli TaxID=2821487 RepID=A0ABS3YQQ3_9BACT|nr:helix-turn-helix transcriptional regulator [Niastella soli]MBO9200226.1 helix-turn-helix transcriptional regulator [Niastella soli]